MHATSAAASPSPATRSVSESTASAHANVWNADTSMNSRPIMRRNIISSSGRGRGSAAALPRPCASPRASASRHPACGMPMRVSIVCVSSSVTGDLERDVARREPHQLVAGLRLPIRLRRARALRTDRGRGAASRCRRCDSSKKRCMSPGCTWRIIEPKPSTVPMRVSDVIVGSRTPSPQQVLRLRDVRERLGPQVERRSRISVPNARDATAATPRSRGRGSSCAAARRCRRSA